MTMTNTQQLKDRIESIHEELKGIDLDTDEAVNLQGELSDLEIKLGLLEDSPQHTPAPWKVSANEHRNEYACVILGGEYNGIIARAELSPYWSIDEAEANAQLIARAPELLKENEQLKAFAQGNLGKAFTESQLENARLQALNAELLLSLKQLRDTTRKINPEYWDLHTANALTYSDNLIAKSRG